jgi:probable phosphoglycerate mutase
MPAKKQTTNDQSSTSKTLFLIRHGQSIANRDYDESIAYRDAGLTEQGIAQARALQKELEASELDLVVVSPLTRALQTCQNALPASYSGPILVLPEIAEICSSHYSCGQKRNVIQPKFPNSFEYGGGNTTANIRGKLTNIKQIVSKNFVVLLKNDPKNELQFFHMVIIYMNF